MQYTHFGDLKQKNRWFEIDDLFVDFTKIMVTRMDGTPVAFNECKCHHTCVELKRNISLKFRICWLRSHSWVFFFIFGTCEPSLHIVVKEYKPETPGDVPTTDLVVDSSSCDPPQAPLTLKLVLLSAEFSGTVEAGESLQILVLESTNADSCRAACVWDKVSGLFSVDNATRNSNGKRWK